MCVAGDGVIARRDCFCFLVQRCPSHVPGRIVPLFGEGGFPRPIQNLGVQSSTVSPELIVAFPSLDE